MKIRVPIWILLFSKTFLPIFSTEVEQKSSALESDVEKNSSEFSKNDVELSSRSGDLNFLDSLNREIRSNEKWQKIFIGLTVLSALEVTIGLISLNYWVDENAVNSLSNAPAVLLGYILIPGGGVSGLISIIGLFETGYHLKKLKAKKEKNFPKLSLSNKGRALAIEVAF